MWYCAHTQHIQTDVLALVGNTGKATKPLSSKMATMLACDMQVMQRMTLANARVTSN